MVTRTPGPFDFYPDRYPGVTGDSIRASVDPVDLHAGNLATLATELDGDEQRVLQETEGDISSAAAFSPSYSAGVARSLTASAYFASGCLRLFAGDVDTFDTTVDGLNVRCAANLDDLHKAANLHPDDVDVAGDAAAYERSLRPEYARAEAVLDDAADEIARQLKNGPTDAQVKQLMLQGLIPLAAASFFPGVYLTPSELDTASAGSARLMMEHLRRLGLLTGPTPAQDSLYFRWLQNAARRGVSTSTLEQIARDFDIRPDDFEVFDGAEEIHDPDGKSYFLLPADISGDDARKATVMTYIFNAGTDYAAADPGSVHDYSETPYSADEVQRIIDRAEKNSFTYDDDVGFVHGNGGRLATTPNGMMMGLGGNFIQDLYSQKGGTTWGDIFMLNIDDPDDAAQTLRDVIGSGNTRFDNGNEGNDLDRVLHHEERHSEQWADHGYGGFLWNYVWHSGDLEEDAGLHDGGYE